MHADYTDSKLQAKIFCWPFKDDGLDVTRVQQYTNRYAATQTELCYPVTSGNTRPPKYGVESRK